MSLLQGAWDWLTDDSTVQAFIAFGTLTAAVASVLSYRLLKRDRLGHLYVEWFIDYSRREGEVRPYVDVQTTIRNSTPSAVLISRMEVQGMPLLGVSDGGEATDAGGAIDFEFWQVDPGKSASGNWYFVPAWEEVTKPRSVFNFFRSRRVARVSSLIKSKEARSSTRRYSTKINIPKDVISEHKARIKAGS